MNRLDDPEFKNYGGVGELQEKFFLRDLPRRQGKYYYRERGLREKPQMVVLFQSDKMIIASATLLNTEKFKEPEEDRGVFYRGALYFDVESIRVFDPVSWEGLSRIWPKLKEHRPGRVKYYVEPNGYEAFGKALKNVKSPGLAQKRLSSAAIPPTEKLARTALFINGIYDSVLAEILDAQNARGGGESFLQPHSGSAISMLRERLPNPSSPVTLYVSTVENLTKICHIAEIVKWEDKRKISESRRQIVLRYLQQYQLEECDLLTGKTPADRKSVNLITIRNLQRLAICPPTSLLIKESDHLPLKERTIPGGWSEVFERDDLAVFTIPSTETEESSNRRLTEEIRRARNLDADALRLRLADASKIPERVEIVSVGYRRNADVIVAVLNRANGVCERCRKPAPFLRKADGTPFLEVHHQTPLAEGGEDTTENALALCPNCHREVHHG